MLTVENADNGIPIYDLEAQNVDQKEVGRNGRSKKENEEHLKSKKRVTNSRSQRERLRNPVENVDITNHSPTSTGRWHISSSFFNSANDIFFRSRGNHTNDLTRADSTEYDERLIRYLDGIKAQSYLPGWFCWIEKLILMIDFFQIFGLIWVSAQPWPWPYLWTIYTRPINGFNVDIFSFTTDGALGGSSANLISRWGQMDNYISSYAIYYAAVAFGLATALLLLHHYVTIFDTYGKELFAYRSHLLGILLFLGYLFFVPCQLAVFRIYYCDVYNTGATVPVDPTVNCLSTNHLMYMGIYGVCIIFFTASMLYYFYYYVHRNITYYNSIDHEKKLQIHELLFMFDLNQDYLHQQLWIPGSFRYFGRYYYLHMMLLKLILLALFIFLRSSYVIQSLFMLLVILAFTTYYTIYKLPFRNYLTNLQFLCVMGLLITNISYGFCNASQVTNVMTTASTETIMLISIHMFFFVVIFMLWMYILSLLPLKLDWPSIRTLDRLYHAPKLIPKVYYWILLLKEIEKIKIDYLLQSSEINNLPLIEYCIQQLRIYYLQAKAIGSIFESILSDYLEELLWIHSQKAIYSYRKNDYWDAAYRQTIQSKLWSRHYQKYRLMNPKKRRILYKLLSYFLLRGGQHYQAKFDYNIALEYQQNQRLQRELKLQKLKELYEQKMRKQDGVGNTFQDFLKDFQSLMDGGLDVDSGLQQPHPRLSELVGTEWSTSQRERFQLEMMEEAKKMIHRLQQRTELALNKHHHAAKAIQEQQKQAQLQQKDHLVIQETSTNQVVNNVIHNFNQYQSQHFVQSPLAGGGGSQINLRRYNNSSNSNLLNASNQSMSVTGGGGLRKITTMDLIKETVDEEERQDLEELYYLWDEAITLYENEEFPGHYDTLNQEVENWYAYRELISKRLEIIVKYLQEQIEMLDDVIDQEVEEIEDDYGGGIEEGDNEEEEDDLLLPARDFQTEYEEEVNEESNLLSGSYVQLLNLKKVQKSPSPGSRSGLLSSGNNSHAGSAFGTGLSRTNTGNSMSRNRNALSRSYQIQQQQLREQNQSPINDSDV